MGEEAGEVNSTKVYITDGEASRLILNVDYTGIYIPSNFIKTCKVSTPKSSGITAMFILRTDLI
jgi:hypothetical protein